MASDSGSGAVDFLVRKSDFRDFRFAPAPAADAIDLGPGQVLMRVAKFAFTANNITYAVVGEAMSYWDFFPAEEGWGRVPVWAFGDVARSTCDGVTEGERFFGYFPMSTHLVMQPDPVAPEGFVDATAHRAALPVLYNQYSRAANDPGYDPAREDHQMVFWPLFMAVLLTSASSKTSISLAFQLSQNRSTGAEVVGLTSPGNAEFARGLGCYDRVLTYDEIPTLPSDLPAVVVDMAGNGPVLSQLHHHLRDHLKHSCQVGLTHWERGEREETLPGPTPSFFFAPTRIEQRRKDWGPDGLRQRFADAWRPFLTWCDGRIRIVREDGTDAVARVSADTLEGRAAPDEAHVLSL